MNSIILTTVALLVSAISATPIPSNEYSPELAKAAMELSVDVYDEGAIRDSLEGYGFTEIETYNHGIGFNFNQPTFAYAEKTTEDGERVVAIVVRGTYSISNWVTNIIVGADEEHGGFSESRDYILDKIPPICTDTTYFVTGYSYGGAIVNLLAVELMEFGVPQEQVYAYTFATPNVIRSSEPLTEYDNIFNLLNRLDFVTVVPTHVVGEEWSRYGKDIWFRKDVYSTSFITHIKNVYLDFVSEMHVLNEDGNIGDISEEDPDMRATVKEWDRTERLSLRRKKIYK